MLHPASAIDKAIIQAYLETDYHVFDDPPFILKVGKTCSRLVKLHKTNHVTCSAFISACNPYSKQHGNANNAKRHTALAKILKNRKVVFIEGIGLHPHNDWPGEPSFLVLGLDLDTAINLGIQWQQNAIIWNDSDGVSHLILLR